MDKNRITGAARQVGGRLRSVAGHAGHDAAVRAEGAYEEALDIGSRAFEQARGRALNLADETYDVGQEMYGRGMKVLSRQANEHPLALVLAAGLAGAALAWIFTSPARRR